jgi:hypothetical protein
MITAVITVRVYETYFSANGLTATTLGTQRDLIFFRCR